MICFNSRARMGRDLGFSVIDVPKKFQFTRPHGARLTVALPSVIPAKFQFTRPHGARRWLRR